ncbi:MAG: hypothetical protein HN580_05390 [Deltaproteobacteria bacterium]|nr:hypothetical protein [Deltaproteobacteria bacterium]MBT6069028.1 hypothetical protein [Candidatus Peregrinibacteria bacterium]MBT4265695.1 hypothetical protein [Deltaproteobacteria bacterium]MBT4637704.1 hypothetical protein [Deltaproteobacteria bacterium]MBT6502231.1 hypothetical protein [Deltaproteobacteria bacterium]
MKQPIKSVQRVMDHGGPLFYWDEKEAGCRYRKGYLLDVMFCENPECPYAHFTAFSIDERYRDFRFDKQRSLTYKVTDTEEEEPPEKISVSGNIDLKNRTVVQNEGEEQNTQTVALLVKITKQAHDDLFIELLKQRSNQIKGIHKDTWKKADWSWWEPGDLVPWIEFSPDSIDFVLTDGNNANTVDDYYCINPGCTCREVTFSFNDHKNESTMGNVSVDSSKWQITGIETETKDDAHLKRSWHNLNNLYPNLKTIIRKRQRDIQKAGADIGRLSGNIPDTQEQQSTGTIGRNDPCPCGSGKKYKKCCLKSRT